jgi:hypothetical protein
MPSQQLQRGFRISNQELSASLISYKLKRPAIQRKRVGMVSTACPIISDPFP